MKNMEIYTIVCDNCKKEVMRDTGAGLILTDDYNFRHISFYRFTLCEECCKIFDKIDKKYDGFSENNLKLKQELQDKMERIHNVIYNNQKEI